MKNKVLSIFHAVIPYVKELRAMAGSMEGCILMQQLDYWFALKPDGFYKFLEPVQPKGKDEQGNPIPGHRLYRTGDSWCEELSCSPHEFRRMFDAIGIRWNSKSEFNNAVDPFCGRGYCSYVDRKENLTHYFRNHALVDAFLDQFVADGVQNLSTSEKRPTDLSKLNPQVSQKPSSIEHRLPAEIISTTTGGVVDDLKPKNNILCWENDDLYANLDGFVEAAYWWQKKTDVVRKPSGFKSTVRKRIASSGPSTEDWETLILWRASQVKPVAKIIPEEVQRSSEQKQQQAEAKLRYEALGLEQQKEIEARFAAYLVTNNTFAYKPYCQSGLVSGVVATAFSEWLAEHALL
jgi:hypothetical protein